MEENGGESSDTPLITPEDEEAVPWSGNSQASVTSYFTSLNKYLIAGGGSRHGAGGRGRCARVNAP